VKVTAEWQCTRCNATNRKLADSAEREIRDRCVTCHQKHVITPGTRPVRWAARAA
jgi:DNA-directed RNA polymerase subunit RPC12/RpoP